VLVSEDGGTTWKILTTPSGTSTNPNNNSYGWGYTGSSGGGEQPEWIQESVDLSAYAGQRIVVGFEVITDLAVNRPGMAIDDVEIPDINYREDFENGDGGWQPAGWVRTHNLVPQKFIVQLISFGKDGRPAVTRLPVDDDNTGHWDVPLSTLNQAVILVSGMAPKTDELARFNWRATQK
jgi:hypothetical protein